MIITSLPVLITGLFLTFEKYLTKPWLRWLWWGIGSLIVAVVAWNAGRGLNWGDFLYGYYFAGRFALTDLNQLYLAEGCVEFVNFPLVAYLFLPFALLPSQIAGQLFYAIGVVSILPLSYWLIKVAELDGWKRWFMLGIIIINDFLDHSLDYGNTTQFIMLGLLLVLWWLKRGKDFRAGVLLGFISLIKIPLILPSGYFFIRRHWRVVSGGILIAGLALGLSLLLIPFSLNSQWYYDCIAPFSKFPVAAYNNQSISGFLARQLMPDSDLYNWFPIVPAAGFSSILRILTWLLYVPVVAVLLVDWRSPRSWFDTVLEFCIVVVCSILTSPISWTHYYMLMLIPISLYLKEAVLGTRTLWMNIYFGFILALLSIPLSVTLRLFEQTNQRIFLSIHLFGGLLLYVFLLMYWYQRRKTFHFPTSP